MTNPLLQLSQAGQSSWLDYLHRKIIDDGQLRRWIEGDGLKGMTSNPSIFEKAIGESGDYDDRLKVLLTQGDREAGDLYERLAIADIQAAADQFQEVRFFIRDHTRAATVIGFGQRYLHSTGQAYKGGPNSGVFLQITAQATEDIPVPGREHSFGVVEAAQARGDLEVLDARGRRILRLDLGRDVEGGLKRLAEVIERSLS